MRESGEPMEFGIFDFYKVFCILSFERGLELMRDSGEPMEFGIFDFYKVFSRAFGEEEDGVGGS